MGAEQDGFPAGRPPGPGPACRAVALAHQSVSGRQLHAVGGARGPGDLPLPWRLRQGPVERAQQRLCSCYLER